ncbi:protein TIME FOR COFFEE isoform X2 [Lathyrus oleraceus]|uniref:Time for coffee n=1 Tax=Pisum sativum TaxID=3888 RepID=A0A9D4W4W0_PEA|nr:protein TIME FOR COFFEE isoform X2 [Pisum sativum]KAI5395172.1 hypothetical protein KIW84_061682 [Pisum sativum]
MDRTRESRRSSTNGFPKLRHRNIPLRDSSEVGAAELREAPSKRGRNRDKDRDSSSKRRRGSHCHIDEDEQGTEESIGNEQYNNYRDAGLSRIRLPTPVDSDQNYHRNFTPDKPPLFQKTDEMIGVAVPRKARSASVKKSHEKWIAARGGGEEHSFRRQPNSPGGAELLPATALPSSNVSSKQKMKAMGDIAKTSKSSSSDMEIEIAELLYGLMTSKNHESSSQKLDATINHNASIDVEKKKSEDCNSTEELIMIHSEQPADVGSHDGSATCHENGSSEVQKKDIGEDNMYLDAGFGGSSADGRPVSTTWGSQSCSKLDADKQYSGSARVMPSALEDNTQRVCKFDIDLMAPPPPPLTLSREGNHLSQSGLTSEIKKLAPDLEMMSEDSIKVEDKVERLVTVEKVPEEIEAANLDVKKLDVLKHYMVKPNNDNEIKTNNKLEEQDRNKEHSTALSNSKVQTIARSSSVPLSAAVSGPSGSLSPIGCTPPLRTVVKTDKTTGSSTAQHVNSVFSQPQRKRCATHYHIARNILHQQFTKTDPLLSAGSGSIYATKRNDVNCLLLEESMVVSKQSEKHLPVSNQNCAQEKGLAATSDHNLTATKSSKTANPVDSTHQMQFVLQGQHPGSTGNLVHGPAFIFSPVHYQASVVGASNQAGGANSPGNASSYNRSQHSIAGSPCTSSTLPAAASAMSFNYPHFSANNSPYATIVHNNGYSFPISATSLAATAAIKGASPSQTTHIQSGPLYSSQTFQPFQDPQQHPHSQALLQPSYLAAQTSCSSSSHMQSHRAQVNGNNILTSTAAERQSQKQQTPQSHPHKQEAKASGKSVQSVANLASYPIKNLQGQNFTIPVQPVNFSFKPCATSDIVGGNSKQQQALNGGVEVIPSQAFAVSFASFNGTNLPSNLNFSSMKQNPVVIQSLPDAARQGYQAASTPHTVQQKTYSTTVEKRGGNSSHQDDDKKTTHAILQVLNSLHNCFRSSMVCNNSNLQRLFEIKLHPPIPLLLQNLLTMALFSHKVTLNSKVLTKLLTLRSREERWVLMLIIHLV